MAKQSNYKNRYQLDTMTPEQKDKAVKKINERYTDICRSFGPNSATAQEYFNAMVLAFGPENMHTAQARQSKAKKRKEQTAGSMKIKLIDRDKKMLEKIHSGDIQALLDRHTAGQIKKTVKQEAKQETEEIGRPVSEQEILDAMEDVNDFQLEHPDSDWYNNYWTAVGGKGQGNKRPSYMTLKEMIDLYKKQEELEDAGASDPESVWNPFTRRLQKTATTAMSAFF